MLVVFVLFLNSSCSVSSDSSFSLQNGDLLFQDLDCGELCDAIEKVTGTYNGRSFSHVGLVCIRHDSVWVIEAMGEDVHLTPLQNFMKRSIDHRGHSKVAVARLKQSYQHLCVPAVNFALGKLGAKYDPFFLSDNGQYYCSELLYEGYKHANQGTPFFDLKPMTFRDPKTGNVFPVWLRYYKKLGVEPPEGKPGCNPIGLCCDSKIDIIRYF